MHYIISPQRGWDGTSVEINSVNDEANLINFVKKPMYSKNFQPLKSM